MQLHLINSEKKVKLCKRGYSFLKKKGLTEGWRLHSAGYAVLQFTKYGKVQTYYLHKLLANQFITKPETEKKIFVRVINGNKLNCQLQNMEWATMSALRRQQRSSLGYRGVSKDGNKYRAVLYDKGERIYIGIFSTPEEAALAYNAESVKRFGVTNSLNKIKGQTNPQTKHQEENISIKSETTSN